MPHRSPVSNPLQMIRTLAISTADLEQRVFGFKQELNKLSRLRNELLVSRSQEDLQYNNQVQHIESLILSCLEQRVLLSKETARCYEAIERGENRLPGGFHLPPLPDLSSVSNYPYPTARRIKIKKEGKRSLFHYIHEVLAENPQGLTIAEIIDGLCRKHPETFLDTPEQRLRLRKSVTVTLNRYKGGASHGEGNRPGFADVFHRVGRGLFTLSRGTN